MYHGGIFPDNIYEKNGSVKLGLPNFKKVRQRVRIKSKNKKYYAPEKEKTLQSDLWSFGILLVDLMKGRQDYVGDTTIDSIAESNVSQEFKIDDSQNQVSVTKETRAVIGSLIKADPKTRMTLTQLESNPIYSDLRPQAFNLTAKMDDLNFPICKMNLYNYDPNHKNFIISLCVKNAEAGQRKTEYDMVYAGYLDGTILLCKLRGDLLIESTQVFKGKRSMKNI